METNQNESPVFTYKSQNKVTQINALQQLTALKRANSLKRFPVLTDYSRLKGGYDDTTANGLTKCIIDFIRFRGGFAKRIQPQGQYRNGQWTYSTTRQGTVGIYAIYRGQQISFEIKVGRNRLGDVRNRMWQEIESSGGLYIVARSFQDFFDWFIATFNVEKL